MSELQRYSVYARDQWNEPYEPFCDPSNTGKWYLATEVDAARMADKRKTLAARQQLQRLRHVLEVMVGAGHCTFEEITDAEWVVDGLETAPAREE